MTTLASYLNKQKIITLIKEKGDKVTRIELSAEGVTEKVIKRATIYVNYRNDCGIEQEKEILPCMDTKAFFGLFNVLNQDDTTRKKLFLSVLDYKE